MSTGRIVDATAITLRQATPADWDVIADVVNAARKADGIAEVRTAENLAEEYPDSERFVFERDMLIAQVGGQVAGYCMGYVAIREGVLTAETIGDVHPAWRRHGVGSLLLETTADRLQQRAAEHPHVGPRERRAYAMEVETSALALLDHHGYVPIRFGFEMRRYLTGSLPDHPVPEGLEIRPALESEHRAIFDADNEAFEDHWGHRAKDESDYVSRFQGSEMDPSLYLVAWDGDQVAGVVMNAIFAWENEAIGVRRGWLEHVSVRRPWRGRGVAKALCSASFLLLREHGMDEAWLGVDGSNPTGALQLYDGLGFGVVRRWFAYGRPMDRPAPAGWQSGGAGDPGSG